MLPLGFGEAGVGKHAVGRATPMDWQVVASGQKHSRNQREDLNVWLMDNVVAVPLQEQGNGLAKEMLLDTGSASDLHTSTFKAQLLRECS